MCKHFLTLHHFLYFLAGAAFWEAVVHGLLYFSGALPCTYWGYTITKNMNLIVIAGAIMVCLVFLSLAKKTNCGCSSLSC